MLTCAHPEYLALLVLAFPWGLYWARQRSEKILFPGAAESAAIRSLKARLAHPCGVFFRLVIFLGCLLALVRPRLPDLATRIPTQAIALVIVLDVSGSMETEGVFTWDRMAPKISRRQAAQRAFHLFVEGGTAPDGTIFEGRSTARGTDAIGLVTFTNYPQPLCPPTLNHSVLLQMIDNVQPASVRDEGSNVGGLRPEDNPGI